MQDRPIAKAKPADHNKKAQPPAAPFLFNTNTVSDSDAKGIRQRVTPQLIRPCAHPATPSGLQEWVRCAFFEWPAPAAYSLYARTAGCSKSVQMARYRKPRPTRPRLPGAYSRTPF
ncbi:hypothetical protein JCM14722_21740 [Pseudodesulfovibrio portus]|uniref:Uncharacterized protein n=1 Tax=Pseudodesulfovibrio portus TaxID=231439 RepID=A0ABM8ATE1_9BACT|nr:hypothetical protein JCM14722_21740 [Pseudodesulfovibrio portus]